MLIYLLRRILLTIPTFLGITLFSFLIINMAPGGPVEQKIQAMRFGERAGGFSVSGNRVAGHLTQELLAEIKKQYGFDQPVHMRYFLWLKNVSKLDFGKSFTYDEPVIDVIAEKFPVSMQYVFASIFLTYLVCVPLGIAKAVRAGTVFDSISGLILYFAYSMPPLVLGIFLITFFASGSHFNWFPIGLVRSDNYNSLSFFGQALDRAHHFILPITCYIIGGVAELTMLTRNSMLDVIRQDYVRTARAKGLGESAVYFKHALKNAIIPVATSLGSFFRLFFVGSLIIETVFNLDGIGLLSFNSIMSRDYNVIMGLIFLSSIVLLTGRLFSDVIYVIIDPRIDFK